MGTFSGFRSLGLAPPLLAMTEMASVLRLTPEQIESHEGVARRGLTKPPINRGFLPWRFSDAARQSLRHYPTRPVKPSQQPTSVEGQDMATP